MILYVLGTPLISAVIVLVVTRGRMGLKEWGARLIRWRVDWFWYLLALFSYPLIAASSCLYGF
jgi:hypothetical protein